MAYRSKRGNRPGEYASKSSHVHVANSQTVQDFLSRCNLPKKVEDISFDETELYTFDDSAENPIRHIVTIDGGYTEVPVRAEFPSATIAFFQFGALTFDVQDLENLERQSFIDPDDMSKLKQLQRLELTLPIRNIALKTETTLTHSVRKAIYDFFRVSLEEGLETLAWFVFEKYSTPADEWQLAICPHCNERNIPLQRTKMSPHYTFVCNSCGEEIFISDVFRLHEAIDDDIGASGVLGYVTTTIEQIILVHLVRLIMKTKPSLLNEVIFIKDGPLAFFGQTANLHRPMRTLFNYLIQHNNVYMAGLEKSGAFVEHADEISSKLKPGQVVVVSNDYIYKYVIPGIPDEKKPYGVTTYYSSKIIFKSRDEKVYVITIPTSNPDPRPSVASLKNLDTILNNIERLRCDMYDDALFPIALVNKLVSLADHPSARILQRFAVNLIS